MTIKIHDLGDTSVCLDEDIAQRIVQTLKDTQAYAPTHLYRGITADPAILKRIQIVGTDRKKKNLADSMMVAHDRLKEATSHVRQHEAIREGKIRADPRVLWAAPESELVEVITSYALPDPHRPDTFSLVLVYRSKFLREIEEEEDLYRFKKGIKPRDALVAGFRF
ncbi:hypothetical protein HY493_00320 [Candidatus Woesearchaeota archaeon]|nr:hypothetical protein [Candidatus Woesearchaeota archaeon]